MKQFLAWAVLTCGLWVAVPLAQDTPKSASHLIGLEGQKALEDAWNELRIAEQQRQIAQLAFALASTPYDRTKEGLVLDRNPQTREWGYKPAPSPEKPKE